MLPLSLPSNPIQRAARVKQFSRSLVYLVLGAACLVACASPASRPTAMPPPTLEDVRNATVVGLFDEPVALRDGRWEGEPYVAGGAARPSAGVIGDLWAAGDLDGDGAE